MDAKPTCREPLHHCHIEVIFRSANLLFSISLLARSVCRISSEPTLNGDSGMRDRTLHDSADVRSLAEQVAQIERNLREHGHSMDDFLLSRPAKAFRKFNEEVDKQSGYDVALLRPPTG